MKTESTLKSLKFNIAALAGITLLGGLIYGHTLNVPWYLDDIRAIVENPAIHHLQSALDNLFYAPRSIADLTFALNYHFGQTNVFGYHLVNIGIHLLTSFLVFLLLKRVFCARPSLALCGALIFVAHPLQTQAVTYIVQRMTSMSALFFFLALFLYVLAREDGDSRQSRYGFYYMGALLCGALAVLIKQNTAVLPAAMILFDRYFLPVERRLSWKKQILYVCPFAVVPLGLAVSSLLLPLFTEGSSSLAQMTGTENLVHLKHLSPVNYLVTEFSVIWIYLRLLFIPYGQALDYGYPVVATIWSWRSLIAAAGIVLLLITATRQRKEWPLFSAGIFWFFLGLCVESTIIPLDPIFEHRLYIPMFGFILIVIAGISKLPRQFGIGACFLLISVLSVLTWQRNDLWNNPIAFYQDNLKRAPHSERVMADLANAYRKAGRPDDAEVLYQKALEINPAYSLAYINLSVIYVQQKDFLKAESILLEGLRNGAKSHKLYNNLGVLYNRIGEFGKAAAILERGTQLEPDNVLMNFNRALASTRLGRLDEAISLYRKAIAQHGNSPDIYFNLGLALYQKNRPSDALKSFDNVLKLAPNHVGALYNSALVSFELGDVTTALEKLEKLRQLDPQKAKNLQILFNKRT